MKNIVGAKENVCPHCQGTMLYIKINKAKVISQCKCGCTIDGRAKDEVLPSAGSATGPGRILGLRLHLPIQSFRMS